jgi:hypothetical protein
MPKFLVWDMSSRIDGVWRSVEADDERSAAEAVSGLKLRTIGCEFELCARVRSLDNPDKPMAIFYGARSPAVEANWAIEAAE